MVIVIMKLLPKKFFVLMNEFSFLCQYPNTKHKSESNVSKECELVANIGSLFNKYCHDDCRRSLEKQHGIKITNKECSFHNDQKLLQTKSVNRISNLSDIFMCLSNLL